MSNILFTIEELEAKKEEVEKKLKEMKHLLSNQKDMDCYEAEALKKLEAINKNIDDVKLSQKKDVKVEKEIYDLEKGEEAKVSQNVVDVLASPAYLSASSKLVLKLAKKPVVFSDEEQQALASVYPKGSNIMLAIKDSITTDALEYVLPTDSVEGINNAGVLIPTIVNNDLLKLIGKASTFYDNIVKTSLKGIISFNLWAYNGEATWLAKGACLTAESFGFENIVLNQKVLAKLVTSWDYVDVMTSGQLWALILPEMSAAIKNAILKAMWYGAGTATEPKGIVPQSIEASQNLEYSAATIFEKMAEARDLLSPEDEDFAVDYNDGAAYYVSRYVFDLLAVAKDSNGRFQFSPMGACSSSFLCTPIIVESSLKRGDWVYGSPKWVIENVSQPIQLKSGENVKCLTSDRVVWTVRDMMSIKEAFVTGSLSAAAKAERDKARAKVKADADEKVK